MNFRNLILLALVFLISSVAAADLQVFPLRVVLNEKERSTQVSLRHRGAKAMQYRISVVYYRMEKNGAMNKVAEAKKEPTFAGDLIRFSPKSVTLEPDVEQIVRVMLRLPAQLAEGEYRAHLHFEGTNDAEDKNLQVETKEGTMSLKARMAIAIPVIVNKGAPTSTVTFSDLKLIKTPNEKPKFSVIMKKDGAASAYGDLQLVNILKDGKTKPVGEVNGISSYIPERTLTYEMNLGEVEAGTLKLIYKKPSSEGGEQIASTETTVN